MKERRRRIGSGNEHIVYESKKSNYVIKKQRIRNKLTMKLSGTTVSDIRNELSRAYQITEGTSVRMTPTRLFAHSPTTYSLVQPRLYNDNSGNPQEIIDKQPSPILKFRYKSNPTNFIMQQGNLYWVDVTKAPLIRFINKYTSINEYAYRRIMFEGRKKLQNIKTKVSSMLRSN